MIERRNPICYEAIGADYGRTRRPDPRIARRIRAALGDAQTVVNVGAGLGSYEPADLEVTAVEPAAAMIAARPLAAAPCVLAAAESLPFPDASFDAAMAVLTMQHWTNVTAGLRELRRVARRRVVLFTWDPEVDDELWLTTDYLPMIRDRDLAIFPTMQTILAGLEPLRGSAVEPILVPHDCLDGFLGAHWRRPEAYLDPVVQAGISSFCELGPTVTGPPLARLAADLQSGEWRRRFGRLLELDEVDLGYRLVTADLSHPAPS
ncbi:MAG: methyltransferase domain-containing protein [Thermoleophilia bacterium]